jgi:hypothetical protein
MEGCGCKICNAGLGDFTNELILAGESPLTVIQELENKGVRVSKKVLKKHLAAFDIDYPSENTNELEECRPVTVVLNEVDFSEYKFDINQPESVIAYLQRLNLKVYLNQMRITLQAQQDVIDGKAPDVPSEALRNLATAYAILDKSTGLGTRVNQSEAIKAVESMGFTISDKNYLLPDNVQSQTNTKTD